MSTSCPRNECIKIYCEPVENSLRITFYILNVGQESNRVVAISQHDRTHAAVRTYHTAQDAAEKPLFVGPVVISGNLLFAITALSEVSMQTNTRSKKMSSWVLFSVNHTLPNTLMRRVFRILCEESTLRMPHDPSNESYTVAPMANPSG